MTTSKLSSKSNRQNGFTILELIVVIVLIGGLLGLIIATRAGVQRSERNTERQRDVKELHVELTAYYALNNHYPTLNDINNKDWRATNMKGLDDDVLEDPNNLASTLASKPFHDVYAYAVTSAKGTSCDNKKTLCTQYTLTATLEGGGTYTKKNLN